MSSSTPLQTPVVIIIYKRPDETQQLMDRLASVKPKKLYVIADAPKQIEDRVLCDRAWQIATHPDWDCAVMSHRSESNLGCRQRVSSGLNWVFEQETSAIILEDDLLPNPSFFRFTEELLNYYAADSDVWHISGNNHQQGQHRSEASYTFSKHTHCWGWATWRRAWKHYEADMASWPAFRDTGGMQSVCPDPLEREYFTKWLDWVHSGQRDSWAYVWTYSMWKGGGLGINPEENLVINIGFGETATHTRKPGQTGPLETRELQWPLIHPKEKKSCEAADSYTFYKHFEGDEIVSARSLPGRLRQWRNGLLRRLKKGNSNA